MMVEEKSLGVDDYKQPGHLKRRGGTWSCLSRRLHPLALPTCIRYDVRRAIRNA